jgi:hypothetical protein
MTKEQWEHVLSRVGAVLNFGIEKKAQVQNSKMAKLIAAVPYLADCNKAMETSFSHLLIYLMSLDESAKDIYFHKPEDDRDIYSRLFPISNFSGGDKTVIQCCMDLISLCMLSNYNKDIKQDEVIGKYNPLINQKWDYDKIAAALIQNIEKTITKEISEIYTKDDALKAFWER